MARPAKRKQQRRVAAAPPTPPPPPPIEEEVSLRVEIEDELRRLSNTNNGRLTPDKVIAAARNPRSVLHGEFTWEDKEAAALRRIDEARRLIRSAKFMVTTEVFTYRLPQYVRDQSVPAHEQGYIAVPTLRDEKTMARETVTREFARASEALARAQALAAYLQIGDEVSGARQLIEALSRRISETRQPGTAD